MVGKKHPKPAQVLDYESTPNLAKSNANPLISEKMDGYELWFCHQTSWWDTHRQAET